MKTFNNKSHAFSLIILLIVFFNTSGVAQDTPDEIAPLIPEGYLLLDYAEGDLNQDNLKDYILVFKEINEEEHESSDVSPVRPLHIIIRKENEKLEVVASNNQIIMCYDCGGMFGDPYEGVYIENGTLTIKHFGGSAWRWSNAINFKYDPEEKDWFLENQSTSSFHASDPDSTYTEEIKTFKNENIRFKDYKPNDN